MAVCSGVERTPERPARPGALPGGWGVGGGVRPDRKRKLPGEPVVRRTQKKHLTTKSRKKNKNPAAPRETQEEVSSIAAISLFTVKESTVLTSSIKN